MRRCLVAALFAALTAASALPYRAEGAGVFTCTQVIGFSQTQEWYAGDPTFESTVDDARWQLLYNFGAGINQWADPGYSGWSQGIVSPCSAGSSAPDRIVLNISGDSRTPSEWATAIEAAISTVYAKYPALQRIVLQPVVGGPNNQLCPDGGGGYIRASVNNIAIDEAIPMVVGGQTVAGPSPEVMSCTDYVDSVGHLSVGSRPAIGAAIASFYEGKTVGGFAKLPAADAPTSADDGTFLFFAVALAGLSIAAVTLSALKRAASAYRGR